MTHPHLEGLIRKWELRSRASLPADSMLINLHVRELRQALAALPGGGVDEAMVRRFVDAVGHPYCFDMPPPRVIKDALKAALSPTPNPNEADRNDV